MLAGKVEKKLIFQNLMKCFCFPKSLGLSFKTKERKRERKKERKKERRKVRKKERQKDRKIERKKERKIERTRKG
jgi:hypothetical protein